jgi:hypothetical protein
MARNRLITAAWACAAAACLTVSGCAVDGYTWEQEGRVDQVVIKMTEVADVRPICARYLPGQDVMACSVQRVDYCEIIVPPNSPALVAHEAAHCLGYRHPGGRSTMTARRNKPDTLTQNHAGGEQRSTGLP